MTKRKALSILGSLALGALGCQAFLSSWLWRRQKRRWGAASLAAGIASDVLFLCSFLIPNFPLTGPTFHKGDATGGQVALTFDDGPQLPFTEAILETLKKEQVKATFFVLGENAVRYPELMQRIEADGHLVANHGMDHSILMFAGAGAAKRQVSEADAAFRQAGVKQPAPLFRAPHGWLSPIAHKTLSSLGYRVIGWSKGVWDTANPGVEAIVSRTAEVLKPGSILLLHDGWAGEESADRSQTAAALPQIIQLARERGLRFVTIEEMLNSQASL